MLSDLKKQHLLNNVGAIITRWRLNVVKVNFIRMRWETKRFIFFNNTCNVVRVTRFLDWLTYVPTVSGTDFPNYFFQHQLFRRPKRGSSIAPRTTRNGGEYLEENTRNALFGIVSWPIENWKRIANVDTVVPFKVVRQIHWPISSLLVRFFFLFKTQVQQTRPGPTATRSIGIAAPGIYQCSEHRQRRTIANNAAHATAAPSTTSGRSPQVVRRLQLSYTTGTI